MTEGRPAARWIDLAVAAALSLTLYALYRATFQERQFGDGGRLLTIFAGYRQGLGNWYHALYVPLADLLWRVFPFSSPTAVLRFLSSGSAAAGAGLAYLLCRAWSLPRASALVATLLLGLSPGWWFFATTIEVHALHAVCVGLVACAVLLAPWGRPVVALLCVALVTPLLFLSHQSGLLLGPGLLLLVQQARRRRGLPLLPSAALLLAVGPALALSMLGAVPIAIAMERDSLGVYVDESLHTLRQFKGTLEWRDVLEGWLLPLGVLTPLALLALLRGRVRGAGRLALLALVVPSLVFFVAWGWPERGGYALATAAFLAVLAALALPHSARPTLALGALLVLAQGTLAYRSLRGYDTPGIGQQMRSRAAAVQRLMPGPGILVCFQPLEQFITEALPQVFEQSAHSMLVRALESGEDPQAFAARLGAGLTYQCVEARNAVVVDLSYRERSDALDPRARQYLDAVEAWLPANLKVTRLADPEWQLLKVEPRD